MQLETNFEVARDPADVAQSLNRDETLLRLFPGDSEIVSREPERATTRTHYRALGREGDAVFNWRFLPGGDVAFPLAAPQYARLGSAADSPSSPVSGLQQH